MSNEAATARHYQQHGVSNPHSGWLAARASGRVRSSSSAWVAKLYPHAVRVGRTKRPVQMAQHRFSSAGRHSSSSENRLDAPAIAFSGVRRSCLGAQRV